MQGFYINLDRSQKRRDEIECQIDASKASVNFQRFAAVDGKLVSIPVANLSAPELGCYLSHLQVLTSAVNDEDILVIEDDEVIHPILCKAIYDVMEFQSESWDIIYLDMTIVEVEDILFLSRKLKQVILGQIKSNLFKIPNWMTVYGTHAYIVNYKNKSKIVQLLENSLNLGLPIDNVFCAGIQQNLLNAFVYLPLPMGPSEETFSSSIATADHPLMQDWVLFRKTIDADFSQDSTTLLSEISETIKAICINRLNFSCLETFNPLNRITK